MRSGGLGCKTTLSASVVWNDSLFLTRLGGELGRVVALALKERPGEGVLASELGEGQVVGVRDDRGDGAIEPEQEVVGPALNRAEDLVEVPAGPPDPNGLDLVCARTILSTEPPTNVLALR
jgi:hypothetical protein